MARKDSSGTHHERGLSDLSGIGLIGLAFLLVVALLSYDPHDLSVNTSQYNENPHNWIGLIGAWMGCGLFFAFGAAAYLVPLFLLAFGLSHLLQFLAYLRRRWVSALVLIVASTGLLDLYKNHFEVMQTNLNLPGAGGLCGHLANKLFRYFGQFGATIIFAGNFIGRTQTMPLAIYQGFEQELKLQKAIAQLPENQRQVLLLRFYSDMKFVEIAEVLGCPLNTALGRVHKAVLKLRQLMKD
jgi:hypothetical protein